MVHASNIPCCTVNNVQVNGGDALINIRLMVAEITVSNTSNPIRLISLNYQLNAKLISEQHAGKRDV